MRAAIVTSTLPLPATITTTDQLLETWAEGTQ